MESNILIEDAAGPGAGTHLNGAHVDLGRLPTVVKPSLTDPAIREEARRRYAETINSNRVIAFELGVSASTLARIANREAWPRAEGAPPSPAVDPTMRRKLATTLADAGAVSARLLRAVDRQIGMIDSRLRKKDAADRGEGCAHPDRPRQDTRNADGARNGRRRDGKETGARRSWRATGRTGSSNSSMG